MTRCLHVAVLLALAIGCSSNPGDPDAGDTPDPDSGPVDLAIARWVHTEVFNGPGTTVSNLDLAIAPDGRMVTGWAEAVESSPFRTAVLIATRSAGSFETQAVFDDPATSFSSPTVFAGAGIHAVANANDPVTNSDLFYSELVGDAWTAPVNITAPSNIGELIDFDGQVLEVGSDIVVVYRSRVFVPMSFENEGLYMLRFSDPASPGTPQTILDSANFTCGGFRAAVDASDTIHIITHCREDGALSELFYLNNSSGSFSRQDVGLAGGTSPLSPDIAVGADGSVHLLWNASTDCGGLPCRDVFYSRDLTPAVSVTGGEEDGGFFPNVTVDPAGRVIVVFHRLANVDDVLWTYAETGSSFVRMQLATPGTEGSTDSSVGNLVTHPQTGLPHMVYARSTSGAGSDVFHGQLVP